MDKKQVEKEIQNIVKQLVEKYKPQKIILFGSAAWGKFGPSSDLDFLIIKEKTPHLGVDRMREVDRLVETSLPCDFLVAKPSEVETRLKMGDPFLKTIFEKGKILYGG